MLGNISRIGRSWLLVKASWSVLRSDTELVMLPLLSGIATILLVASFVGLAFASGAVEALGKEAHPGALPPAFYGGLFVFYVVQYFVVIFFNTALVGAAIERLEGGDPTLGSALALAGSRLGAILGYAVVSATIGVVLRMVAERLGFIGRLIEAGAGLAWTVTTFLAVPVLAAEGVGPLEAIGKSAALLRKTWGENIVGNAGISLALSAIVFVACLLGFGGGFLLVGRGQELLAIPLFFLAIFTLLIATLLGSALSSVYAAVVYRYAVSGQVPRGFDGRLVRNAFQPKSR
jgi:hypothetical protein